MATPEQVNRALADFVASVNADGGKKLVAAARAAKKTKQPGRIMSEEAQVKCAISKAVKEGYSQRRRDRQRAHRQATAMAAQRKAQNLPEPVSADVKAVIRSEARKRAAPWEGRGNRE